MRLYLLLYEALFICHFQHTVLCRQHKSLRHGNMSAAQKYASRYKGEFLVLYIFDGCAVLAVDEDGGGHLFDILLLNARFLKR